MIIERLILKAQNNTFSPQKTYQVLLFEAAYRHSQTPQEQPLNE